MTSSSKPAHPPVDISTTAVNDWLTQTLSTSGWSAQTEDDYDRLNDLTLDITSHLESTLTEFLNNTASSSQEHTTEPTT